MSRRVSTLGVLAALAVILTLPCIVQAQSVYLPIRHPVYDYFDRLETKFGTELITFSRPMTRMDVAQELVRIYRSEALAHYDRSQIRFYFREFAEEIQRLGELDSTIAPHAEPRWNLIQVDSERPADSYLAIDLIGRGRYELREDADNVIQRSNGVRMYGYVGNHLGAEMKWIDNGLQGINYDPRAVRVPDPAVVKGPGSGSDFEYEIAEGQFNYSTPWLEAGIQKMDLWWGSGRNGSLILSDHAPSFPRIDLKIDITDWLQFEYFHAWLFSDEIDSTLTYQTTTGLGAVKYFETKYMAAHALSAKVLPNLELTLGESIIYGGSDVNVLFLIPVISFRAADRWTKATTGNSQFFANVHYAPIPNLTLYGSGFIDEMDLSKILGSDPINKDYHVGYTLGLHTTDLYYDVVPLPSETRLEFSRVYIYTYTNYNPQQQYSSHKATLGHWIGPNADIVSLTHRMHPHRAWSVELHGELARFGDAESQLSPPPRMQPPFLYRHEYSQLRARGALRWTPIHELYAIGYAEYIARDEQPDFNTAPTPEGLHIGLQLSYGIH